jgi:hypothetical protein
MGYLLVEVENATTILNIKISCNQLKGLGEGVDFSFCSFRWRRE